jgi:hypothetical protein
MNSHPVLFADSPETFLKFIQATARGNRWWFFVNPFDMHLKSLWILFRARAHHTSPFDIPYWTTTPSQYGGQGTAAKFSVAPCSTVTSKLPDSLEQGYLQDNMATHLARAPVCLQLLVQHQVDPLAQPIEDPSILWDPAEAPMTPVAKISFYEQTFRSVPALLACEREIFDPWESLPEHEPLGGMNRVRRIVYQAIADFRLQSHEE